MGVLDEHQISELYKIVSGIVQRHKFRARGKTRNRDDADEATHVVFLRLWQRAEKHWDKSRGPLSAYIAASAAPELIKFRRRESDLEIRQTSKE